MTFVLIGKDLVLEGSTTRIEDKRVPGIYIYLSHVIFSVSAGWKVFRFPNWEAPFFNGV